MLEQLYQQVFSEQNKGGKNHIDIYPQTVFEVHHNNFLNFSTIFIKINTENSMQGNCPSQPVFNACQTTCNIPGAFEMRLQSTVRRDRA